jgi:malic enzyme
LKVIYLKINSSDFTSSKAFPILQKYRNDHLCFNDDIQGTGGMVLAGLLNCLRAKGLSFKDITKQKIVVVGAGNYFIL